MIPIEGALTMNIFFRPGPIDTKIMILTIKYFKKNNPFVSDAIALTTDHHFLYKHHIKHISSHRNVSLCLKTRYSDASL